MLPTPQPRYLFRRDRCVRCRSRKRPRVEGGLCRLCIDQMAGQIKELYTAIRILRPKLRGDDLVAAVIAAVQHGDHQMRRDHICGLCPQPKR